MTDSPEPDKLQFLSEPIVTANHSFIRWHGRQVKPRYNYLYSRGELKPWVDKVKQISLETALVRGYFNNHYGARAVVNAIEFKEMIGPALSEKEKSSVGKCSQFILSNLQDNRRWMIPCKVIRTALHSGLLMMCQKVLLLCQ